MFPDSQKLLRFLSRHSPYRHEKFVEAVSNLTPSLPIFATFAQLPVSTAKARPMGVLDFSLTYDNGHLQSLFMPWRCAAFIRDFRAISIQYAIEFLALQPLHRLPWVSTEQATSGCVIALGVVVDAVEIFCVIFAQILSATLDYTAGPYPTVVSPTILDASTPCCVRILLYATSNYGPRILLVLSAYLILRSIRFATHLCVRGLEHILRLPFIIFHRLILAIFDALVLFPILGYIAIMVQILIIPFKVFVKIGAAALRIVLQLLYTIVRALVALFVLATVWDSVFRAVMAKKETSGYE
ncbi:hypothetical protein FKW77_001998 [Venturia effusa]|uniref:Uncharacterized protein n=1 Tax=Venturia effusa TaxID=50376 RepID=A0A517LRG3_9PEZI|nr:hypothetical protein FKW77_001998 [Venturia effusa]